MSKAKKASAPIGAKTSWKNAFKRDWQLYLMLLFPLAMVIIFNYASYPGLRMIFMDYLQTGEGSTAEANGSA